MSFHALIGAFPIAKGGTSLEPIACEGVGSLRGASRSAALFEHLRRIHEVLALDLCLHFLFRGASHVPHPASDHETHWTVLDDAQRTAVLHALDDLLRKLNAQPQYFEKLLAAEHGEIGEALACVNAMKTDGEMDLNSATACDDGDTLRFAVAVLGSLRALIYRASNAGQRVAVFTWSPS